MIFLDCLAVIGGTSRQSTLARYSLLADHELTFKRLFRKQVGGWSEVYEPRRGSGVGMPDLQLLVGVQLVPVEVKVGEISCSRLFPERVRPEQISWHDRFHRAGGVARFLIGVKVGKEWDGYLLKDCSHDSLAPWRRGWDLARLERLMHQSEMVPGLSLL